MFNKLKQMMNDRREGGSIIVLSIMTLAIMSMIGASFSMMVSSEARSVTSDWLAQQALYAAESGIQDVLYQRSKKPAQTCFPFFYKDPEIDEKDTDTYSTVGSVNTALKTSSDEKVVLLTGASAGMNADGAPAGNPSTDMDEAGAPGTDKMACGIYQLSTDAQSRAEYLPCWPYNERLYENSIQWGPDFHCHDGSTNPDCSTSEEGGGCTDANDVSNRDCYSPLFWWPASPDGAHIGWKDVYDRTEDGTDIELPLTSASAGTGARYTTGFFTLCNDDFSGIEASMVGYDNACTDAQSGQPCDRYVTRLTVVSVGEVQNGSQVVRRAVKIDMQPPALFTGVIDQYVNTDFWGVSNINGPLHINGLRNDGKWYSFLNLLGGTVGALFDAPDLVSVSYPEDPANPDWQPTVAGFSITHKITYVHIPFRLDLPAVNWDKWEDQMADLYTQALAEYNTTNVYPLKRCEFTHPVTSTAKDCGSSDGVDHYTLNLGTTDQDRDAAFPAFMSMTKRYNTGVDKIHNFQRYNSDAQQWGASTAHVFDLFDHWEEYPYTWVEGTEPPVINGGTGPRDRSLRPKVSFMLNPNLGLGCLTCVIGDLSIAGFMSCCVGKEENRPEFVFMGKHEFRDFVFIDGIIGIGQRAPWHTCGDGDGGLGVYCIVIPNLCLLSFGGSCVIEIPGFSFGLPHWHTGAAIVTGEMLVNGRLHMADYIHIDGGTIYADGHIIKDESSAYDITINLQDLLCWLLGPITTMTISIPIFGDLSINLCDIIFAIAGPIISAMVPWWPEINLTNSELLDFETYLDIDGIGPSYSSGIINPGTLYTHGDFRLMTPGWDATSFIANTIIGLLIPWLKLESSVDPIRIYNGGAIVAGGTTSGNTFLHGNIYLDKHKRADLLTYNPETDENDTGYVIARGAVSIWSDIISHYGMLGLTNGCSTTVFSGGGLDEDCAANGIFYSGGYAAGATNKFTAFGRSTLSVDQPEGSLDKTLASACEPLLTGNIMTAPCWLTAVTDLLTPGNTNEYNIRGHLFAGAVGAMAGTHIRLDQDTSVRNEAVKRQYYKQLSGTPINWQEIEPPANLPHLED